jgi:hypothetical protein
MKIGNILSFFSLSLAIFLLLLYTTFVTFPPFLPSRVQKKGESDQGGVKNGEGKTEKLKMFPIFGGLPRL